MDVLDQTIESDIWNSYIKTWKREKLIENGTLHKYVENEVTVRWKKRKSKKKTNSLQNAV